MQNDTIAAIATGLTNSGISIIRISGSSSVEIADKIFFSPSGRKLGEQKSHTIHYGFIYDDGNAVDEVMAAVMRAPRTYTREDIVELDCHGGVVVTRRVFDLVVRNGARPAEPGEFTKRAFLNGRIDLSRAEAVIELINAKNSLALKNSVNNLKGRLYGIISRLRNVILTDTAFIEAAIDDPEHISLDGFKEKLRENAVSELDELNRLYESSDNGRYITEGIRTLILGKPNSGKSSLMNLILDEERAIVTDIAGTTRDTLEESVNIDGISLNIIDTAGIRSTDDEVERIGVQRALDNVESADLIIYVVDSSCGLDENDYRIIDLLKDKTAIILYNKTDLDIRCDRDELTRLIDKPVIDFSAKNGWGLDELRKMIASMFFGGKLEINDEVFITNERHKDQLYKASEAIRNVVEGIDGGMPEDFYTIDLMEAYTCLGKITGENVEEDLVNKIFSEFCMGK